MRMELLNLNHATGFVSMYVTFHFLVLGVSGKTVRINNERYKLGSGTKSVPILKILVEHSPYKIAPYRRKGETV